MIYPNDDFSIKDKYDEYLVAVQKAWSDFSTGMSKTVNVSLPKKESFEKNLLPHSPQAKQRNSLEFCAVKKSVDVNGHRQMKLPIAS